MIRSDLLASPADSAKDARELAGELAAARRKMEKEQRRLLVRARAATTDHEASEGYRFQLARFSRAKKRFDQLAREVPAPTSFWVLGVWPLRKVYGVPGWANPKMLLPWWARGWVVARKVKPRGVK